MYILEIFQEEGGTVNSVQNTVICLPKVKRETNKSVGLFLVKTSCTHVSRNRLFKHSIDPVNGSSFNQIWFMTKKFTFVSEYYKNWISITFNDTSKNHAFDMFPIKWKECLGKWFNRLQMYVNHKGVYF